MRENEGQGTLRDIQQTVDTEEVSRVLCGGMGIDMESALKAVRDLCEAIRVLYAELEAAMEKACEVLTDAARGSTVDLEEILREIDGKAEQKSRANRELAELRKRRSYIEGRFRAEIRRAEGRRMFRRIYKHHNPI